MAQVCHRNTYCLPDIEEDVEELDIKIGLRSEIVEDLEKLIIKKKLETCNVELKNAQRILGTQERELRSLRDRYKQLENERGNNEESEALNDIERRKSLSQKSFEMSELCQNFDNLKKETVSLKRTLSNKNIEISQLKFRNKLLEDTLKGRKLGESIKLCNVFYEKACLQDKMEFLQDDNLKKDEELLTARLEQERVQEWKMDMTDHCPLNVTLTEHELKIRNLQETIKQVIFLNDECQRALDKSLQKEAELHVTVLQLEDENMEKENKIKIMAHRMNRCIGMIHDNETGNKNVYPWQRQIQQLKIQLEQSYQEVIRGEKQAKIAQEKMSKEIESLKDKIKDKEVTFQSIESEVKQLIKTNEDEQARLNGIISHQSSQIIYLQAELKTRSISHTIQTQLRHAVKELEQKKCEIEYERKTAYTTQKQMDIMFEENEHLKVKISERDRKIQELNDNTETLKNKSQAQMDETKKQIVYLQEKLNKTCDEMALLRINCTSLRSSNQQKSVQISELKHATERNTTLLQERESELVTANNLLQKQFKDAETEIERDKFKSNIEITKLRQIAELKRQLKEITKASQQKESELGNVNSSLQLQLKTMETDLKKLTLDFTRENELARTNKVLTEKMNGEIESLKLELMKKERNNKNLKDDNHRMKKEETKLKSIVNKQSDEIKDLKGKIEEKDIEVTHVDQSKELEQFQQELNKLKGEELDLRENNQVLQNRNAEIEHEVTVLKDQLDEISKTSNQTENELRNINHSIKQQVKNAEIKLEHQQLEIAQEKQLTQTNQTRIEQLTKELECLNLAMKEKDMTLQKYHEQFKDANKRKEQAVLELNIFINKQKKEIQYLQGEIEKRDMKLASVDNVNKRSDQLQQTVNESHKKESELSKTINDLQRDYQVKEDLVSNLNSQLNEMSEAFNKRETELKIINRSLQTQLNTTKGELEQLHKDVSHDKALVSTNKKHKVEMGKEIEKLKQDLEHKEITFQEHKVQYNTCIKTMQEEELKLNGIIEEQKCIIQYLKEDNKKKDMEVNSIEEIKKQKDQVQEALDALRVKEATLYKRSRFLEIKNKEKDGEVTELQKQLDDLRKTSNQKDNELRNSNISLKQQLNIKEKELRRKEEEHSNVKALISTKDKREITMAEEIERLKVEVKLKETLLQECNVKLKDAVKVKEGTESNLKEIIIKQNEDINNLKAKIKMQNDQNVTIDEVENRRKQIQQALNESHKKEAELGRTIDILQRKDKENEGQIRELKDQMNELSNTSERKENQLQSMNSALQTQLKNTESKLKELHQGNLHEKESLSTYKKQMVGLNKEIESLQQEVKLKDARISEFDIQCKDALKTKQEAECKLKEIINKQNNEIQHLKKQIRKKDIEANDIAELKKHNEDVQRAFNDLCEKEADLHKSNKDLHCKNREKEDEVRELKKQLSEMLKTASQKENESKQIIHSIEQQLQNTEANMRQQQVDLSKEKNLMNTKDKIMVNMTEEIKSLKLQVKQKESTLQKCSEKYIDAVKLKEEAESKLNKTINIHKTEIRHLQEDIERKDNERARIEQIYKRYEKVQSELNEFQEKEVTFLETIKVLKNINQENENKISELKRKLDKTLEESHKIEYECKETKHLLNQKIKSIETEKDQYKQDIANAKQLSKAAQKKMSEMDTQINELTNKLKTKEEELQKGEKNVSGIIDSQSQQIQHLEKEVQKRERKMKTVEIEKNSEIQEIEKNMVELKNQMKHLLSKLRDTEAELDETKSRLSREMGDRLTDNNPNITDLSDRNRPTKIAEKCAELYDNEWTDAFDDLEKLFRTEEAAIEALLLILQNAMHFCKTMAQRQIEFIEREMYFADEKEKITVSSDIQKLIKDRRKATATAVVGNLKKIYVAKLKQSKDKIMRAALDVEPYTSECIEICWFMLIQDPPVVFAPLPIKGSSFDTNFYKPYTKSGTHVDFAVWPALLLHEKGPILAKGVTQGHGNK